MGLTRSWKSLSVAKKLYMVLGIMGFLIAMEMFTLFFAMETLSAVRAFVTGESSWSKGQKDAVISLHRYARTQDKNHFEDFFKHLQVPLGDREARLALAENPPNEAGAYEGFRKGTVHPDDIPKVINLVLRFHGVDHLQKAMQIWREGDALTEDMMKLGRELHENIQTKSSPAKINETLLQIDRLNDEMTRLEINFSNTLGEASRWLENLLMIALIGAVFLIEGLGLLLTISLSRNLSKGIRELKEAAIRIGKGQFDTHVPIRSTDDLGQLAEALNGMALALRENIGERKLAEHASQVKSLFLANMSHEIRTPLSAIIGFSDLLKANDIADDERLQYAQIINRTGEHLTHIINDVLDLSKVESGHLEVERKEVFLPNLLNDIHVLMVARCGDKPIDIEFNRRGLVPDIILTDEIRLKQILTNILGNAIKFTEKGFVRMTYEVKNNQLFFTITDTGVGIRPEHQDQLFTAFTQVDGSVSRKYEGTGLGLVLSRKLAQLMKGNVVLEESSINQGSTFIVCIALEIPITDITQINPLPSVSPEPENELAKKSILIVDDVEDNRLLIQRILSKRGADLTIATNGQEGLTKALEKNYDVILMDIQMPVMDGYTATKKLRQAGYKKPIIALTAHAMKDDRDRCLEAGCTDYLTKPVHVDALVKTILNCTPHN